MKRFKMSRFLSLILTAAMMFASLQSPAYAEPMADEGLISDKVKAGEETSDEDFSEAVDETSDDISDAEDISVSGNEIEDGDADNAIGDEGAAGEEEAADPESVYEGEAPFEIIAAQVMYGEDGSNKSGNLDKLFMPRYTVSGNELKLASDIEESVSDNDVDKDELTYSVEYKFFTDTAAAGEVSVENFDELEGVKLETIDAGTEIVAAAKALGEGVPSEVCYRVITIGKRPVIISVEKSRDIEVSEKEMPEDETVTVSANSIAFENVTLTVVENTSNEDGVSSFVYADDEALEPANAIEGDVVLDVSGIDGDETGYQEVPVIATLNSELSDNYVIAEDPEGYIYVEESKYWLTFSVEYKGVVKTQRFQNTVTGPGISYLTDYLSSGQISNIRDLTKYGFTDIEPQTQIVGWGVSFDGRCYGNEGKYVIISPDLSEVLDLRGLRPASPDMPRMIQAKNDYYYTAHLVRQSTNNIYVSAIPGVHYDGRAHVASAQGLSSKKRKSMINDLDLHVYYTDNNSFNYDETYSYTELRFGTDYKVTYKNNIAATMTVEPDGTGGYEYKALNIKESKRPCAIITGKGAFKGFKTTVYFNILPYNFGREEVNATISGLKHIYSFNKHGKISDKVNVSVKMAYTYGKTLKLKEGRDYKPVIYKWDGTGNKWVKQEGITKVGQIVNAGDYLYTIYGIGNYCGIAFGDNYNGKFVYGNPFVLEGYVHPDHCYYNGKDYMHCQFRVTDSRKYDLANAKITIKKKSLAFGRKYYADDFGIKVKDASGTVIDNSSINIIFDGNDYQYVKTYNTATNSYGMATSTAEYTNNQGIFVANKYSVRIEPKSGSSYFGTQTAKKQIAIKGKKPSFKGITFTGPGKVEFNGTYDFDKAYMYNYKYYLGKCPVTPIEPKNYLQVLGTSGTVQTLDYEEKIFSGSLYALPVNTQFVTTVISKNPGIYQRTAYAFGPNVDHSKAVKSKYKRVATTMGKAFANGIINLEFGDEEADKVHVNAGGALPKKIWITFGKDTAYGAYQKKYVIANEDPGIMNCEWLGAFDYNNKKFTLTDGDKAEPSKITITLSASQNTGVGTGVLTIKGDGKLIKGKTTKRYNIYPKVTSSGLIIYDPYYEISYGNVTKKVYCSLNQIGNFRAVVNSTKKPKGKVTEKYIKKYVTLYQTYYANATDAKNGLASLAKVDPKKYRIIYDQSSEYPCVYTVKLGIPSGKTANKTGYDFSQNPELAVSFDVYDKAVKIRKIKVKLYPETTVYELPKDQKKFAAKYTGNQIKPAVEAVVLSNGTVLEHGKGYSTEYGSNVATGKNTGKIFIYLSRYNEGGVEKYPYGGSATFTFRISNGNSTVF